MKQHYIYSIGILCLSVVLGSYGCASRVRVNGGGTFPSSSGNPADKTVVGFYANNCTPGVMDGNFNFHDKKAPTWPNGGVKLNGKVVDVTKCSEWNILGFRGIPCGICNLQFCNCVGWPGTWEDCVYDYMADPTGYCPQDIAIPNNLYGVGFQYTSTNPRYPGSGIGVACVMDNGQGKMAIEKDMIEVMIGAGPYQGYTNQGALQGNVNAEPCCHNLCQTGFPPVSSCDPCVANVCAADSHCCETAWDADCIADAQSICGLVCSN